MPPSGLAAARGWIGPVINVLLEPSLRMAMSRASAFESLYSATYRCRLDNDPVPVQLSPRIARPPRAERSPCTSRPVLGFELKLRKGKPSVPGLCGGRTTTPGVGVGVGIPGAMGAGVSRGATAEGDRSKPSRPGEGAGRP